MKKLRRYHYERYALLCELSYPNDFDPLAFGFSEAGNVLIEDQKGHVAARVLWGPKKEVVVVIRGSKDLRDWLINMQCWLRRVNERHRSYSVHWGYSKMLDVACKDSPLLSIYERLRLILLPLINEGRKVSITGHSSGGAIGILIAQRLFRQHGRCVKRVVTFGQPAVGDYRFKRQYPLASKTFRVCCDVDLVTFLPPFPGIYYQVGRTHWLHDERIYEDVSDFKRLLISLSFWLTRPVRYHFMDKYIRRKNYFDKH